jgi:hypothetical protein
MMWIVCNNIFVGNSVGGYVFSSRHSPPPAPDRRPYVKVNLHWSPSLNYFMVPVVVGGGGGGGGGEFLPLTF